MTFVFMLTVLFIAVNAEADFTFGKPVNLESVIPILDLARDAVDCFSYDGLEMFIDSKRSKGYGDWDLWVSRRATNDSEWGPPENLGPIVNTPSCDSEASISADGLEIYFTSDRPSGGPADIYYTTRTTKNDPWGLAMNLGAKINSSYHDSEPWIRADGLELYFGSWRPGGHGEGGLWVATRQTTSDSWAQPVNLGPIVNGPSYDGSPCVSSDGRTLFFHSRRQGGHGKIDLWMTRRASVSDPWGPPLNLGPQVSRLADNSYPRLSPDERTLYFWSGGSQNHQVPIIPICDLNRDGIVDAADMCIMIDHWGENDSLCDIGPSPLGDGIVDVQDLIILAEHVFEETRPAESVQSVAKH